MHYLIFLVEPIFIGMITISIQDENFSGAVLQQVEVGFASDTVTIKDIIEARVRQEVDLYNNKLPDYFNGLIEPSDAEKTINGYKLRSRKLIDGEKQVYVALDAFLKNAFFVLVDNEQCESLEQTVKLTTHTHIGFVKLTPLVGG